MSEEVQIEELKKKNQQLTAQVQYHKERWTNYEQNYILPCFKWAEERGIDLHALVRDHPGKNCVELLINAIDPR